MSYALVQRIKEILESNQNDPLDGISQNVIDAGIAEWDKSERGEKVVVNGELVDWDDHMIVGAILKACIKAIISIP